MKNPVFHGRSKHIDIRYHFIRECVEKNQIEVEHVSGDLQKADILTKALARTKYAEMRELLGVKDLRGLGTRLGVNVGIISSLSEVQGAVCTRRKSQGPNRFITNLITNKRLFFCVNRHKPTNTPFGRKPRGTMVTFQIV